MGTKKKMSSKHQQRSTIDIPNKLFIIIIYYCAILPNFPSGLHLLTAIYNNKAAGSSIFGHIYEVLIYSFRWHLFGAHMVCSVNG